MKTNIREIPYSARRYWVSNNGTITDRDGVAIPTYLKDGHIHTRISWVNGEAEYKVALLVLLAFRNIELPDYLFGEVEPLYRDGDCNNLSVANILYRLKSGSVEVEGFSGFYYIPMFSSYAINLKGEILNHRTGKYKTWSFTKPSVERNSKGGYAYNRVVGEDGRSVTLFRHRALILAFKDYDHTVNDLVVNHIDGVPGNDWLDNLELVTHRENNIHAVVNGLRLDNKPVLSKNLRTNEIIRFESANACAKHYNHPQGSYIRDRIKSGRVYSDLLLFKDDDGTEWPEIDITRQKVHIAKHANTILGRNVFTGELVVFNGTTNGSNYTGVKPATILKHAKEEMLIPINGWNFRYAHSGSEWPKHSAKHLKIYEEFPVYPPDGLNCTDVATGEEKFYTSVANACKDLKIQKAVIYHAIREDKLLNGRWKFSLFDIRKCLSHPTE